VELDIKTRQKIIAKQTVKYNKASKKGKGAILDSLGMTTGLSRSRLKHLLAESDVGSGEKGIDTGPLSPCISPHGATPGVGVVPHTRVARRPPHDQSLFHERSPLKRGRKPKYTEPFVDALEWVWELMSCASGRRLAAGMSDVLDALERKGVVCFGSETLTLLREVSASTIDRLLRQKKERLRFKGMSTTKPGTLLKQSISIRDGTQWSENEPGYTECDLVAHCGASVAGQYINTLDMTDINTQWTETRAVINKAQKHVFEGILHIRERLPFPLLGIDSDNGSEFINDELFRYCQKENLLFTRGRPYKKNDGCHVEQKNWSVVRKNIGYNRYEGEEALNIMNAYYDRLRLYTNFFLPSVKLISKNRDGPKVKKRYDPPLTPYRRVLASPDVLEEDKDVLNAIFLSLNPLALKRDMIVLLAKLQKLAIPQ